MSHCITLPRIDIAHHNFCSSVIGAANRVFAVYQVNTAGPAFWVVEMDAATRFTKPCRPPLRYANHTDALDCLSGLARGALGYPETLPQPTYTGWGEKTTSTGRRINFTLEDQHGPL
jgi:hypothetical protein